MLAVLASLTGLEAGAADLPVGADLAAWRDLTETAPAGDEAVLAYRAFIEEFPSSPLAEVAWDRLHAAGAERWDSSVADADLERIRRSWAAHHADLGRSAVAAPVQTLTAEGEVARTRSASWSVGTHAGGAWGANPSGALGVSMNYRAYGVVGRVGFDGRWLGQAGVRLSAPGWGPFGELAADTRLHALGLLGGRVKLGSPNLVLEGAGGLEWADDALHPAVRVEIVSRFSRRPSGT